MHFWLRPSPEFPISGPYMHDEALKRWEEGCSAWPEQQAFFGADKRHLTPASAEDFFNATEK